MRISFAATVLTVVTFVLLAAPGQAAGKKKQSASPLNIVVLPFVGQGSGGSEVKEAIELELELVDIVRVVASRDVEAGVAKAGRRAWESDSLASVLKAKAVDVLVRGERAPGIKGRDVLWVTAWGRDGKPRFEKSFPLGQPADETALTVVASLRPTLAKWRTTKPIRLVREPGAPPEAAKSGGLEPADVLVNREDEKRDDDDDASDGQREGAGRGDKRGKGRTQSRRNTSIFDGDGASDVGVERSRAPTTSPWGMERDRQGASIDDDDGKPDGRSSPRTEHVFAFSAGFDGGSWFYDFTSGGVGDQQRSAPFFPGGAVQLDMEPFAFAGVHWVAIDGDLTVSGVSFDIDDAPFRVNGEPVTLVPSDFVSVQTRAGAALKLRHTFDNGIALGLRVGYRHIRAGSEPQIINLGGTATNLTVVPGFVFHGLATGLEASWSARLGQQQLGLGFRADGLPVTFYAEAPDNPGGTSLAFGWVASLRARYVFGKPFFVELVGHSTGIIATYTPADDGAPTRFAVKDGLLVPVQGGNVLNHVGGFTAGLGFAF